MHILYIGWAHHVHLRRWAEYFAKLGHKITILSRSANADPLPGVRIIPLLSLKKRKIIQEIEVAFWVRLLRPDICHVHWARFAPLLTKVRDIPYGITVWGSDIYNLEKCSPDLVSGIKTSMNKTAFITCDSNDLKREIKRIARIPTEKIHLIQWGVNTSLFRPISNNQALKRQFGLPSDSKVLLSIRNISPLYQTEIIFEAFAKLLKRVDNLILIQKHYHADESRLRYLKKKAESEGIIHNLKWIGNIRYEDLPKLYNIAELVISIPISDGTPMSLLEAMACGIPVVAADLPSIREWIVHKKNGILVDEVSPEKLYDAICELLEKPDLTEKIGKANIELILQKANQTLHMMQMQKIYKANAIRANR